MADRVRRWRQSRPGMSLSDLATLVGVTRQAVSNWERGVTCPTLGNMARIANAVGISLGTFWGEMPTDIERRQVA